jgi:hypothetical protein
VKAEFRGLPSSTVSTLTRVSASEFSRQGNAILLQDNNYVHLSAHANKIFIPVRAILGDECVFFVLRLLGAFD